MRIKDDGLMGMRCGMSPYGIRRQILITEPRSVRDAENVFSAAAMIVGEYPCVEIVSPNFTNTAVDNVGRDILGGGWRVVECSSDRDLQRLIKVCYTVVSDMRSICELSASIGKPILVTLPDYQGRLPFCARLVGTEVGPVYRGMRELLENDALYYAMENSHIYCRSISL